MPYVHLPNLVLSSDFHGQFDESGKEAFSSAVNVVSAMTNNPKIAPETALISIVR